VPSGVRVQIRLSHLAAAESECMTANVTKLEDNKVRLDVEVPPKAVREGVEAKVRELGRKVRGGV